MATDRPSESKQNQTQGVLFAKPTDRPWSETQGGLFAKPTDRPWSENQGGFFAKPTSQNYDEPWCEPVRSACLNGGGFSFGHQPPNYKLYNDRLKSFQFWPCSEKILPQQLAKAGLYYTGQTDKCRCVWCEQNLFQWDYFDEPLTEHRRYSKNCAFLKMILPSE